MYPRANVTPSGWWFAAAGLAALAGLAAGVAVITLGATAYVDNVEDFERAVMPATLEVEITEPGGYSIYHEYDGLESEGSRVEPDVEVTDPAGNDVVLRSYGSEVTYDVSGHAGVGVYTFRAEEAGTYEFEASMPLPSGSDDLIAVGPGLGRDLALSIVGGVALIGVGLMGGTVIAIVIGVLRSRSRRAATAPAMPWAPPGSWGAPQWPPAPPGSWGASQWPPAPTSSWGASQWPPAPPPTWSAPPPPPPPTHSGPPPQDAPPREAPAGDAG